MDTDESADAETTAALRALGHDIRTHLLAGRKHTTSGLGTFSTCTRKATAHRAACRVVMFRGSALLQQWVAPPPKGSFDGPHAHAAAAIARQLQASQRAELPGLGYLEAQARKGATPRLVFRAAPVLAEQLDP